MAISAADSEEMAGVLRETHDLRQRSGSFRRRRIALPATALATMIAGEYEYEGVETCGRRFSEPPKGIPGERTFARVFRRAPPRELPTSMQSRFQGYAGAGRQPGVPADGETIRGGADGGGEAIRHEITALPQVGGTLTGLPQKARPGGE